MNVDFNKKIKKSLLLFKILNKENDLKDFCDQQLENNSELKIKMKTFDNSNNYKYELQRYKNNYNFNDVLSIDLNEIQN